MLSRILFVCLSLSLYSAGSSLSCRWVDHKFRQHSETSLDLLNTMANNSTNSTEDAQVEDTVAFPNDLYSQASKASAEDKLHFTVQVLEEAAALFEEDHSNASWEENTVENFVNVVNQQADGLRSCTGSHGHKKKNKKLHMYFKRLSSHVLKKMSHSAEAWELIRKEIRTHLMRADQLVSSLLNTN
ncbi:interferon a3-like isoform X1 [Larimichthys crocea]|uniref:interferon a3-like isoform X1 n=1 Tax=Larimichthys crocea TaxID=215358 RepID=UPI000F5E802B|nr:interferon a3-like isoform X1 [Larimichthys crocea]XP_027145404.1 interferon a3-like isoform X1 [Larimichthys crocea]